jgi:hypothetical protein
MALRTAGSSLVFNSLTWLHVQGSSSTMSIDGLHMPIRVHAALRRPASTRIAMASVTAPRSATSSLETARIVLSSCHCRRLTLCRQVRKSSH